MVIAAGNIGNAQNGRAQDATTDQEVRNGRKWHSERYNEGYRQG